MMYTGFSLLAR